MSGTLGDAAGALRLWQQGALSIATATLLADYESLRLRLLRPTPRVTLGLRLRAFAHAAVDVSDGLLADLGHIADASRCRSDVERAALRGDHDAVAGAAAAADGRRSLSGEAYDGTPGADFCRAHGLRPVSARPPLTSVFRTRPAVAPPMADAFGLFARSYDRDGVRRGSKAPSAARMPCDHSGSRTARRHRSTSSSSEVKPTSSTPSR